MNTFKMGSITFTHIANISLSQAWLVNRNSETYGLYDFEGNEYATRKHWFSLLPRDISGVYFFKKGDQVLYVGESGLLGKRIWTHGTAGRLVKEELIRDMELWIATNVTVPSPLNGEPVCVRGAVEAQLMAMYSPQYNRKEERC
ncbi:hypothetical protein J8L86_01560 [Shewanella sp. MMG014]|uniref:hypothetical protein n=1 Tax=Shewanella sp. MMG014 TaxID=2822691 RepID=UPI001B390561|nr:hypothetical protein [Shewanella sp. MMG014]MBQ4888516.1 hypothetical protein [Shewanella sp. MMG014]